MSDEEADRGSLGTVRPMAEDCVAYLGRGEAVSRCAIVGSVRRWRETAGDVNLLATGDDPDAIVERLRSWPGGTGAVESTPAGAAVLADGVSVTVRIVPRSAWGPALQHFTGSVSHNRRLRARASDAGLDVADGDAEREWLPFDGASEDAVYERLGLDPIPPELREDAGEIEAAAEGTLPVLLEPADVRGDLHVHTNWSDGDRSVEEMVAAAADAGHEYVCITDHAAGAGVVGGVGLTEDDILDQRDAVREAADRAGIDVLHGIEANIEPTGEIAIDDGVLADLDVVIASSHLQSLSRVQRAAALLESGGESGAPSAGGGEMTPTDRFLEAIAHPHVDIIGHPTGRHLEQRSGLDLDVAAIAEAAVDHGVALEVNSNPARLDLRDEAVRVAVEAGATLTVNTDAHGPEDFGRMRYGVHTARRGWADPDDVLNTLDIEDLRRFLSA